MRSLPCWSIVEILSNLPDSLRAFAHHVVDSLLPRDCFVCGHRAGAALVCGSCRADLPSQPPACPVCAIPVDGGVICGSCQRHMPSFDATSAALPYAFPVDRLVQALKYRRRLAVSAFLAQTLASQCAPVGATVIVPMPLHDRRLRERGFNQSVEIARPLAQAWGLPLELEGVRRVRDTRVQASLPWAARRVNMRGAFRCDVSFHGRAVVVIDDVMTTGATLDELARTLKMNGAIRVENRIVARTPLPA